MPRCWKCSRMATDRGRDIYCDDHVQAIYNAVSRTQKVQCENFGHGCMSTRHIKLTSNWNKFNWLRKSDKTYSINLDNGRLYYHEYCAYCYNEIDELRAEINLNRSK